MKNLILDPVVARLQFAARFSLEDWQWFCSFENFTKAVEDLELGIAEVISHEKFTERDEPVIRAGAAALSALEKQHELVREFVSLWAQQLGRTGRKWKQSRQNHIRRLMQHGLTSDYASKMRTQAGI